MRDLTDDVALIHPVINALRASGCDPDRVLVRVGLPPGGLPVGRFPHSTQNLFWKAAIDECDGEHVDPCLAGHLPALHGLPLEYLFLPSDTFGTGLRHPLRYVRLLSDTLQAQLEAEGERTVPSLGELPATNRRFPEMLASAVIRLFSALTEGEFKPPGVQPMNETGAPMERYRAIYGYPTILGISRCTLVSDAVVLDKPSRHTALELLCMHESLACRQLAEVERLDLVRQIHELIGELLVNGGATLEQVVAHLGMLTRRLCERLAIAKVHFNDLVASYRCRLAKELLLRTDERIGMIVERTGFSKSSTFYRAFKRWVDGIPVEFYRHGQQGRRQGLFEGAIGSFPM